MIGVVTIDNDESRPVPVAIASDQSGVPVTNAAITSIDTKTPSKGQAAMAASTPVVIASDQSAVTVTNAAATSIDGKFPAKGQAAMAASVPVVVASDQSAVAVARTTESAPNATLPAKCDWIGASDGSKLQGLLIGQQVKASSLSICMASDSALLTANSPVAAPVFPAQVTVGVTATAFGSQACLQGCWIQALSTNTVSVWIGTSDLTTSKGWELAPGASVFIPVSNMSAIYHISTTTEQKVNLMAA
jgi:hypothetical protein